MTDADTHIVELTREEIKVALALMRLGVRHADDARFDDGASSYLHLRAKLLAAASDNVVPMKEAANG